MANYTLAPEILEAAHREPGITTATAEGEVLDLSYLREGTVHDGSPADLARYLSTEPEEEEAEVHAAEFVNESSKLYLFREFTLQDAVAWIRKQYPGSAPAKGVGIHHTAIPEGKTWWGMSTLKGIANYYANERGWKYGVMPHLWIYGGDNPNYLPGQIRIYVATHFAHDGIGISYRNHRWIHMECVSNGDARRWGTNHVRAYRELVWALDDVLKCGVFLNGGPSHDGPSTPQGQLPHRAARTNIKSCPGNLNPDAFLRTIFVARPKPAPAPAPTPAPTPGGTITGAAKLLSAPRTTEERVVRYIRSRAPNGEYTEDDVRKIVRLYFTTCKTAGLDPLILAAQMIHETDFLKSPWSARPHRNPAGIGVVQAGQTPGASPGVSFASWQESVVAHVGRMLAYALPAGQGTTAQKDLIDRALGYRPLGSQYRGLCPTLGDFGGKTVVSGVEVVKWAADENYEAGLLKHANAIGTEVPPRFVQDERIRFITTTTADLNLRERAGEEYPVKEVMPKGTRLGYLWTSGDTNWCYVQELNHGHRGFCVREHLARSE